MTIHLQYVLLAAFNISIICDHEIEGSGTHMIF